MKKTIICFFCAILLLLMNTDFGQSPIRKSSSIGSDTIKAAKDYHQGEFFADRGQFDLALLYFNKAYDNYKKHDLKIWQAKCLNKFCEQYFNLKQVQPAMAYGYKALRFAMENNITKEVGGSYNNIGVTFTLQIGRAHV